MLWFKFKDININKVSQSLMFDGDFTFLVCMKTKYK